MEKHAITGMRVIMEAHPNAANCKLNCFEGSIESLDRKTKEKFHRWGRTKCYTFSTNSRDRDSFAYPIHVAAEAGYKVRAMREDSKFVHLFRAVLTHPHHVRVFPGTCELCP